MKEIHTSKYQPVIVGAMGGSGTRIITDLLEGVGFYMGEDQNESNDTMYFVEFYQKWINRYFNRNHVPIDEKRMRYDFLAAFRMYLKNADSKLIGWKNPRSIHLLDFFNRLFPAVKFIHVIRDGRDIAYSKTQIQVEHHSETMLGHEVTRQEEYLVSALLWEFVNLYALKYAKLNMRGRYIMVRYEDFCRSPIHEMKKITNYLGVELKDTLAVSIENEVGSFLKKKSSIGRYKRYDREQVKVIENQISEGLKVFGYR